MSRARLGLHERIAITGASGLIGSHTAVVLRGEGHEVRAVSTRSAIKSEDLEGCDAVVHLAGEPVAQRWTAAAKERDLIQPLGWQRDNLCKPWLG